MVDPLSVVTNLVNGILSRVGDVKTNEEECKALACLMEQTLGLLKNFETKDLSDPSVSSSVEHLHVALDEASKAIENCCSAAFFSVLLWPKSYSSPLKRAFEILDSALSQVCFASLSTTAQMKSDMEALLEQLRRADFNKRESIVHHTNALKKVLEKGFYQQSQEIQEVKRLIRKLMQGHTSNMQEFCNEVELLNKAKSEAKERKDAQMENELQQVIIALSESTVEANEDLVLIPNLKRILCCPITNEIMKDPVLLKESGVIYDRLSITKRLRHGNFQDPATNVELICTDFVRCYVLRDVCHELLKHDRDSSFIGEDFREEKDTTWFAPGVYEGHGKIYRFSQNACVSNAHSRT